MATVTPGSLPSTLTVPAGRIARLLMGGDLSRAAVVGPSGWPVTHAIKAFRTHVEGDGGRISMSMGAVVLNFPYSGSLDPFDMSMPRRGDRLARASFELVWLRDPDGLGPERCRTAREAACLGPGIVVEG